MVQKEFKLNMHNNILCQKLMTIIELICSKKWNNLFLII